MATTKDIAKPAPLMAGKKGLVTGVANDRSIAWGIARALHGQGAELAFSYQGGAFGRRAVPLAESIGAKIIEEADVEDLKSVERVFAAGSDRGRMGQQRHPTAGQRSPQRRIRQQSVEAEAHHGGVRSMRSTKPVGSWKSGRSPGWASAQ